LKMDVGFLAFVKSFVLYRNETTYLFGCIWFSCISFDNS
jgi:hypothetical protein